MASNAVIKENSLPADSVSPLAQAGGSLAGRDLCSIADLSAG